MPNWGLRCFFDEISIGLLGVFGQVHAAVLVEPEI